MLLTCVSVYMCTCFVLLTSQDLFRIRTSHYNKMKPVGLQNSPRKAANKNLEPTDFSSLQTSRAHSEVITTYTKHLNMNHLHCTSSKVNIVIFEPLSQVFYRGFLPLALPHLYCFCNEMRAVQKNRMQQRKCQPT